MMIAHPRACPCEPCFAARVDLARVLVTIPVERRTVLAEEALAMAAPRLVPCTACGGACVITIAGTDGRATVVCTLCGGRGRHVEGKAMPVAFAHGARAA